LKALSSTSKHFKALFRVFENYLSDFDEIWLKMKLRECSEDMTVNLGKVLGSTLKL
jgi:hypothetical protein